MVATVCIVRGKFLVSVPWLVIAMINLRTYLNTCKWDKEYKEIAQRLEKLDVNNMEELNTYEADNNAITEEIMPFLEKIINEKLSLDDILNIFEEICKIPLNEERILYETGTFHFTGERFFQISFVRQFSNEEEEYGQIHVDILYQPTDENKVFNGAIWDEDLNENLFDYIRKSPAFLYAKGQEYIKVEVYRDET